MPNASYRDAPYATPREQSVYEGGNVGQFVNNLLGTVLSQRVKSILRRWTMAADLWPVICLSIVFGFVLQIIISRLFASFGGRRKQTYWPSNLVSLISVVWGFNVESDRNEKGNDRFARSTMIESADIDNSQNESTGSSNIVKDRNACFGSGTGDSIGGSSSDNSNSSSSSRIAPRTPKHIAVIMDGNRRFGREKHNDPLQGHSAGGQTLVDFIKWCREEGLEEATLYAFSSENWSRDPIEVNALMAIFAKYAEQLTTEATAQNVRVNVLSTDLERLPSGVRNSIRRLVDTSKNCTGFQVNMCVSYGGRDEILQACSRLATQASRGLLNDSIDSNGVVVSESMFREELCSAKLRDPDLLIRTSGEFRLSNFLLWQLAYTELFFVNKYWPEMTKQDLQQILSQFRDRNRRFGE